MLQAEFDLAAARGLAGEKGVVDASLARMQDALDAVSGDLQQQTGASMLQVCSAPAHGLQHYQRMQFCETVTHHSGCRARWV